VDQSTLDEMKQVCHGSLAVCTFLPRQPITSASIPISCTSTLHFLLFCCALQFPSFSLRIDYGDVAAWLGGGWAAESGARAAGQFRRSGAPSVFGSLL
jgi:hypothetical protein